MAIVLIFLGCFLLYAKSKHLPVFLEAIGNKAKKRPKITRLVAYMAFVLALLVLAYRYGFFTGSIIFFTALMLGLCLVVMLLPLHNRYAYLLIVIALIIIVIENRI